MMNPLKSLHGFGQSVWLDYIRRSLITSGELERLVRDDGLRGVTSNPAIFEKAIAGSSDYTAALAAARKVDPQAKPMALYEGLAIEDIQNAADILRPVYDESRRMDGCVSLEVSPYLARDAEGTLVDAKRLWREVDRPNVMIKIPATPECFPAVQKAIAAGINVNVTLLFSVAAYEQVVEAYLAGLEQLLAAGGDLSGVASVASFFISRIDAAVDKLLEQKIKSATSPAESKGLSGLLGKVAIANAKIAYDRFHHLFSGPRWEALQSRGAQVQRLLWASTGTKNPKYRDTLYVEELIGPDTVDTVPPATFDAFRAHGEVRATLASGGGEAPFVLQSVREAGIDFEAVTGSLLTEGLQQFAEAFDKLLAAVAVGQQETTENTAAKLPARLSYRLPEALNAAVKGTLEDWQKCDKARRLWARDASLWTNTDEASCLGWLGVADEQTAHLQHLQDLSTEIHAGGFEHALLLGMGGSSLCPQVLRLSFGTIKGFPDLRVLDSTDPAQVARFAEAVDWAKTLCIVSSKSGGTLEPNIFKQYFFEQAKAALGEGKAGAHFIAITDPGSHMQSVAERDGFRHVFFGLKSIGGRYSALSDFGLVPAAVMGLDVKKFLDRTGIMVHACGPSVPVPENPGVVLGAVLGTAAVQQGRDKVTLVTSEGIRHLGAWLEQLLAESTGKEGRGLVPVDGELLGRPEDYGTDRVFVSVREKGAADGAQQDALRALAEVGHPVVWIEIEDRYDLGQQFFQWEIATAVAGSILGINAFNQPDVEASKIATRKLTTAYETDGHLPAETPFFEANGIALFSDGPNVAALDGALAQKPSLAGILRAHLDRLGAGDYFALLAYIDMNDANERVLADVRQQVRDARRVATCLGFGPRFLHSTGQAYKGGPNSGVFLQVTCDDARDVPVPGQKYTFGVVKAAQALGDFQVLSERGRRVLRVHLGKNFADGMHVLTTAMEQALD